MINRLAGKYVHSLIRLKRGKNIRCKLAKSSEHNGLQLQFWRLVEETRFEPKNGGREVGRRRSEVGASEARSSEAGGQRSKARGRKSEVRIRRSEARGGNWRSEVRGQTIFRFQTSDIGLQTSDFRFQASDFGFQTSDVRFLTTLRL